MAAGRRQQGAFNNKMVRALPPAGERIKGSIGQGRHQSERIQDDLVQKGASPMPPTSHPGGAPGRRAQRPSVAPRLDFWLIKNRMIIEAFHNRPKSQKHNPKYKHTTQIQNIKTPHTKQNETHPPYKQNTNTKSESRRTNKGPCSNPALGPGPKESSG